jgi:hypothetical protein
MAPKGYDCDANFTGFDDFFTAPSSMSQESPSSNSFDDGGSMIKQSLSSPDHAHNSQNFIMPENPFDLFDSPPAAPPVQGHSGQATTANHLSLLHHSSPSSVRAELHPQYPGAEKTNGVARNVERSALASDSWSDHQTKSYESCDSHSTHEEQAMQSYHQGIRGDHGQIGGVSIGATSVISNPQLVAMPASCCKKSINSRDRVSHQVGTQGSLSIASTSAVGNPQFTMPLSCHKKSCHAETRQERVLHMATKYELDELKPKHTGTMFGNPKCKPVPKRNEQQQNPVPPTELEPELQKQDLWRMKAPGGMSIRRLIGNPKTKPNIKKVIAEAQVIL